MKTLVTFYSRTGNTKKMGELIAQKLHADIDEIVDHTDRSGIKGWIMGGRDAVKRSLTEITVTKDPADYDLVVIGTPVWAGPATPAFRTYIAQYKNKIKKVALFITSGGDGPRKAVDLLEDVLGKKCLASVGWTNAEINQARIDIKLNKFIDQIKSL
jgi:flavodoxin